MEDEKDAQLLAHAERQTDALEDIHRAMMILLALALLGVLGLAVLVFR